MKQQYLDVCSLISPQYELLQTGNHQLRTVLCFKPQTSSSFSPQDTMHCISLQLFALHVRPSSVGCMQRLDLGVIINLDVFCYVLAQDTVLG